MTQSTHVRFAALVAAGFFVASHGIAYADTTTSGNGSIGGGNQLELDLDAPINLCGNAVAILGVAGANCTDGDATVVNDSSTKGHYPGYDPEVPGKPGYPENPGKPEVPENPENPEKPEVPENPEKPEVPENPEVPEGPSAPPADENLAVTGADQSTLTGLLAAAVLAIAAGAGFLLFGKRRRA
jgi:LPXTG-motif cell wall-anchored protein